VSTQDRFSDMAAIVAHELVTPLTVIRSAVDILRRHGPDDDPAEHELALDTIERHATLAQMIVEGMRTSDGDGSEDVTVDPRPVDMADLVRSVVGDLGATLLRAHPTSVEAPDAVVADADEVRVRQVLVNLLSNAAKFSPEGRHVWVMVEQRDHGVRVTVRDQGSGVAPEAVERIFRKWERDDEDRPGLGLGLHVARGIIRAHGGDLWVDTSADDEGAVFVFELPRPADATGR
jgi:two-component system sensor kinase FixL